MELTKPLAPFVDLNTSDEQPAYSGFPWWYALLVEPNREQKSADVLQRVGMHCYLPTFVKQQRVSGPVRARQPRLSAVVPGLLFMPEEYLDVENRAGIFDWARVRGYIRGSGGLPARLSKADIEIVREIEGKLNLPIECRPAVSYTLGQPVRFTNEVYAAFWGTGTVFEVAGKGRIGVEVKKLIGSAGKVYVPASEIEAM